MNISLTPELERYVNDQVASGMYNSASEVMRDGLRTLIDKKRTSTDRLMELRREIDIGLEQSKRGDVVPFDLETLLSEGRQLVSDRRK